MMIMININGLRKYLLPKGRIYMKTNYNDLVQETKTKLDNIFPEEEIVYDPEKILQSLETSKQLYRYLCTEVKKLIHSSIFDIINTLPYIIKTTKEFSKLINLFNNLDINQNLNSIFDILIKMNSSIKSEGSLKISKMKSNLKGLLSILEIINLDTINIKSMEKTAKSLKEIQKVSFTYKKDPVTTLEAPLLFVMNEDFKISRIKKLESYFPLKLKENICILKNAKFLIFNTKSHKHSKKNLHKFSHIDQINALCDLISKNTRVGILPIHKFSKFRKGYYIVWTIEDRYFNRVKKMSEDVNSFQIFIEPPIKKQEEELNGK